MSATTIHDIFAQFCEQALNNRDLGDGFERLLCRQFKLDQWKQFHVTKMTFAKPTPARKPAGLKAGKTRIHYNTHLILDGTPLEAYDDIVNGKPALEWIMECDQITIDKASGIKNDPNGWCREQDSPRYIVDFLKRVTRVSRKTSKTVNSLPALNERK